MDLSHIEHWDLKAPLSSYLECIDDLLIIAQASQLGQEWNAIECDMRNKYEMLNPTDRIIYTAGILAAKINSREPGVSFRNFNSVLDSQKLDIWDVYCVAAAVAYVTN